MGGGVVVATWNTKWATLRTTRGHQIASRLNNVGADVIVITEGANELLPAGGNAVDAGTDWGYANPALERRKVIVWSRFPMSVQSVGEHGGTLGRLVVVHTEAPDGTLRIIGVCIPWKDAHVSTGRGDARPWSEHLDHLDQLDGMLTGLDDTVPTIIAGDFNQRIPRVRQPVHVADRMAEVFRNWSIHTAGELEHGPLIDHVVTNPLLALDSLETWPGAITDGDLSDHSGVSCRLTRSPSPDPAGTSSRFVNSRPADARTCNSGGDADSSDRNVARDPSLPQDLATAGHGSLITTAEGKGMARNDQYSSHGPSWTERSFLDALAYSGDRSRAERLFELRISDPECYCWFGQTPRGAIFFHPFGMQYAPLSIGMGAGGELVVIGTWNRYPAIRKDERFADLADYLGQDHTGPASPVTAAEFDVDALWSVAVECARRINSAE